MFRMSVEILIIWGFKLDRYVKILKVTIKERKKTVKNFQIRRKLGERSIKREKIKNTK